MVIDRDDPDLDPTLRANLAASDVIHDNVNRARHAAYELGCLADAAYTLGQDRLAGRLGEIAEGIVADALAARDAYNQARHAEYQQSSQFMGKVVTALVDSIATDNADTEALAKETKRAIKRTFGKDVPR